MHREQQIDGVKVLLKKKVTELVNVPPGCTSWVQPFDFSFNKPFKDKLALGSTTLLLMNSCFQDFYDSTELQEYPELCQTSKMKGFARIFIVFLLVSYFRKMPCLKYLAGL